MQTWNNAVWIMSDLQIRSVSEAQSVLGNAVADIEKQQLPLDAVWCLGDVLEGADLSQLEAAATEIIAIFEKLGLPVYYLMGNHDMDLCRRGIYRFPLYEAIRGRSQWYSNVVISDMSFTAEWAGYHVRFLGDHVSDDGTWFTSHDKVVGDVSSYPHGPEAIARLREDLAECDRPVLMASHGAFPEGPRWGMLHEMLLPLPKNVRAAFFGHAHVGDPAWNPNMTWQREFAIRDHITRQYNISAIEPSRSPGSNSAVLLANNSGYLQLQVRCHQEHAWVASFEV